MSECHYSVFTGWMPFLTPNQHRQSTEGSIRKMLTDFSAGKITVSFAAVQVIFV